MLGGRIGIEKLIFYVFQKFIVKNGVALQEQVKGTDRCVLVQMT